MDTIVRVICVVLLIILVFCVLSNMRILIESNKGKKFSKKKQHKMVKPLIIVGNLIKVDSFFVMINHGPDLCEIEIEISNISYYKNREYLLNMGEDYDKD